ncbi:MAG: 2,3-bisphosphoglycerate-independent phosphoglycerate mutase, partial [Blastocatellia bacterium]|nr:2,3-bisphosphoglycerate-independent phosphoglycerate mutase [Blastocatellia bacterium]
NYKITQNERFPHLTYFFNGGDDVQHSNEQQVLVPTLRSTTIDSHPESQSFKLADKAMRMMESCRGGLFVINLPAAGIAAEAGSYAKAIEATQFVDVCLGGIIEKVHELGGVSIITSSHGNCESIADRESGGAKRLGTENAVPFTIVSTDLKGMTLRNDGTLADVAPTLLSLYGVAVPSEMTGRSLIVQ